MKLTRIEITAPATLVLIGTAFLYLAAQIETTGYQTAAEALVGPAMIPKVVAVLIIGFGALELLFEIFRQSQNTDASENNHQDDEAFLPITWAVALRIAICVTIGLAYVWLLAATGYIISTATVLFALLVLFGTKSAPKLAALIVCGTSAYYFIFIRLMGLYDPTGWLINFG